MAAPAANSVAALAATSFGGGDNTPSSCVDDPNFATICSFIQNFGEIIRIGRIPFDDLQKMLENSADVPLPLSQLHITLLRRVFKTVTPDKWERSLAKFGHTYCSQDAWEIERFGYKKAKIQTKLRLLKNLLEAQFDYNVKFKAEVNKLQASDLRLNPLGRDTEGQVYWYQVDEDANLRVYREDIDDETWEIVASNRDELEELISQLQRGEVKKPEPEEAIIVPEEDSNSKDDIEPKEIILDTGKVEDDGSGSNLEISSESDEGDDNKQEKRTVEPLIIKHSFNIHKVHAPAVSEVEKSGKSDVDKVQNEVSSESEPKVPGIKLVFGVKSSANPEKSQPNPDTPHADVKKPSEETSAGSDVVVETISSAKWSICTSAAAAAPPPPPQTDTDIVPKSESSENTTVDNVDEYKRARSCTLVDVSPNKQIEKVVPIPIPPLETKDVKNNAPLLSNQLPLPTSVQTHELQTKANKNRQKSAKVTSISTAPPQTDIVPKSEPSENTVIHNIDESKAAKSDTLEAALKQIETKSTPTPPIDTTKNVTLSNDVSSSLPTCVQQRELQSKTSKNDKLELTPTTKQVEKMVPTPTPPPLDMKKHITLSNELALSTSVQQQQRELQTKANKIQRQKSAKVNSIVERLNKKLPENSAKTLADLIPPPKITKLETETSLQQQKHTSESTPTVAKSESKALPSKDNKLSSVTEIEKLPISQGVSVDINVKVVQSKAMDLTSTSIEVYESPNVKKASYENAKSIVPSGVEKVASNKPVVETQSSIKNPKSQAVKESIITASISSEPLAISQNITIDESSAIKKEPKLSNIPGVSSSETSSIIPKDNGTKPHIRDPSVVPEKNVKDSSIQPMVVEEEIIEKKEAWICGKQEIPVKEELVIKEKSWVCGGGSGSIKSVNDNEHVKKLGLEQGKEKSLQAPLNLTETRGDKETIFSKPPVKTPGDLTTHPCSETLHIVTEESLPSSSDLMKETTHGTNKKDKVLTGSSPTLESSNTDKVIHKKSTTVPVIIDKKHSAPTNIQTVPEDLSSTMHVDDKKEEIFEKERKPVALSPSQSQHTTVTVSSPVVDKPQGETESTADIVAESKPETVKESDDKNVAEKEAKDVTPKSPLIQETLAETKPMSCENVQPAKIVEDNIAETQYSESKNVSTVHKSVTDTCNTLPTGVSHTIDKVGKTNPETSQCLTNIADTAHQQTVSFDKSLISTFKENINDKSKVENTGTVGGAVGSNSSDKKIICEKTPAKVNSALVLYSESSESSNEAFVIDTPSDEATASPANEKLQVKITEKISTDLPGDKADSSVNNSSSNNKNDLPNNGGKELVPRSDPNSSNSNFADITRETEEKLVQSTESTRAKSAINTGSDELKTVNDDDKLELIEDTPKESKTTSDCALLPKEVSSAIADNTTPSSTAFKRKAESDVQSLPKIRKLDDDAAPLQQNEANSSTAESSFNPIVGDTVEEKVMTITGEGSGALNEGRNSPVPFNPICGETIEEEVVTITGFGFGALNEGSNENSPVSLAVTDVTGSQNESIESDESRDAFVAARGRGGRRGRGRRGRPPVAASGGRSSQPSSVPRASSNRGSRGSREVARLGVSLDSIEVNGENERPVRASRRIAQIRLKEEEERRKLEEERLAQLKAAQIQKKAKQEEKEKTKDDDHSPAVKAKKGGPGRKSQKEQLLSANYVPSGTESEDNSEDEEEGSDEFSGKMGKKQKRRRKNGKAKKGGNPWATSDEDEEEEQVEEEEEYHYEEEEEEELVFKSDHEFSPESDMENDGDVGPSRHARTAKQDKGDLFEEGNCCKCGKGDHPEWILLCDKCDKGWHASCLRPQLWVIPEGEWFCPPCQHNMLIENLSKNLVEYESLLKKRENEILRKQRLAYVGISLDNVLPDKEPEVVPEQGLEEQSEKGEREKRRQRRRILSDEELSDDFINDGESDDDLSRSRSGSSEDSDEPVYRLRARRTKKAFDFKEYDDMINSALRVDDDEDVGEVEKADLDDDEEEEDDEDDDKKLNGDDKSDHGGGAGGGKNDAFLKQLEKQAAQEEDETDEELLDEKERLRRKELKKQGQRKARRRINDLDAYSDEEDSDDDFKASEAEDDEEELAEDGESEWSGDKMEEDSDDSIAKRARRKDRQGRHGRLGRREKYSDKGLVRRSTRKRRSRISYDESDDDDDEEEDQNDKWQSDESEEEEEESESNSESDDATWGKRKKKGFAAAKPKLASFVLGASSSSTKGKGKGGVKRKKRKTDEDDVDRAWNSARSKKDKEEPIERRTRGRKINFKDILDSGESDDDGNIRPKRRPLSDSEDSRSPSSSRRLAEEIRAENARRDKEYEENKAKMASATSFAGAIDQSKLEEALTAKEIIKTVVPAPTMPESLTVAKLAESSVNKKAAASSSVPKMSPSPTPVQLSAHPSPTHVVSPLPVNLPPISSPLPTTIHSPSTVSVPSAMTPLPLAPNSSPLHLSTSTPPQSSPPSVANNAGSNTKQPDSHSSVLPKSPPPPVSFMPKSATLNLTVGPSPSTGIPIPQNLSLGHIPPGLLAGSLPINVSAGSVPPNLSVGPIPSNVSSIGTVPPALSVASLQKSSPSSIPSPVPAPILTEKKSKQSKGSRGSRGSKSEKQLPPPPPVSSPSGLELALTKPVKTSPLGPTISKSSSKRKDREREAGSLNVPNPSLLMAGGVLPELLGVGLPASLRAGIPGSTVSSSGSSSSSKKGKSSSSSRTTQQTTPPPVSQNLSPSLPIDIDRVPNPALFQGNPGLRPFHPMWARGPPPPGYSPSGSPGLGKPPPLNTSPFSGQQGPPPRSGFSSPPPLRIPNPNTSPLQAFQHFKRDGPLGATLYRLPPGQPQPGGPLANILPPGMMSPHAGGPERFFGAPSGYPHPYGLLPPPHSQGPPQALFPYDYRAPEPPFKEEPTPPRTTSSSLPTPVSSASSSPPPTTSASVPLPTKDEGSAARDSEFGGLVSYFSSQRSEEDMDT